MSQDEARRLKHLEAENARLKKLAAELSLDNGMLSAAARRAVRSRGESCPSRRREAVRHLRDRFGVSERRACRVVGQPRATQRHEPQRPDRDRALVRRIRELSRRHPRYGYRRITALLRREGAPVNRKRVYRLWRQAGLRAPQRQRKRRRVATGENGTVLRPTYRNHVWS